jgi:putative Mg2+ transporter-C (MgtC) family protein
MAPPLAASPMMTSELVDIVLRLLASIAVGAMIGLDRDLNDKPVGMRTLALVALGAALITVSTVRYANLEAHPDALSRVVQGVIQGIVAGVGFIGGGVILRNSEKGEVQGLTTAAAIWVAAALGIACGLGSWHVVWLGGGLTVAVLVLGKPIERLVLRLLGNTQRKQEP